MIDNYKRCVLYNQYEILRLLDEAQAEDYEIKQSILTEGSDKDVMELLSCFEGTNDAVAQEVLDILGMYYYLYSAQDHLIADPAQREVLFNGFDNNNENEHYTYCRHVIKDLVEYPEFYDVELDSHSQTLPKRRRMLETFNSIKRSHEEYIPDDMTQEEFDAIMNS